MAAEPQGNTAKVKRASLSHGTGGDEEKTCHEGIETYEEWHELFPQVLA